VIQTILHVRGSFGDSLRRRDDLASGIFIVVVPRAGASGAIPSRAEYA